MSFVSVEQWGITMIEYEVFMTVYIVRDNSTGGILGIYDSMYLAEYNQKMYPDTHISIRSVLTNAA